MVPLHLIKVEDSTQAEPPMNQGFAALEAALEAALAPKLTLKISLVHLQAEGGEGERPVNPLFRKRH